MDFSSAESIRAAGFCGFRTIGALKQDNTCLPESGGVYLVLRPDPEPPSFVDKGSGGYFKGKDPSVSREVLEEKWIPESVVLYIGKAGGKGARATLRSRIGQYLKFGSGKNAGHWGGRYIWQLRNAADLVLCWKVVASGDPRAEELGLIEQFEQEFRRLPYANLSH